MDNQNSFSHNSNYHTIGTSSDINTRDDSSSNSSIETNSNHPQVSTQFVNSQQQQPQQQNPTDKIESTILNYPRKTILSILKEGKINPEISLNNCKNDSPEKEWLLKSLVVVINQLMAIGDSSLPNYPQFSPENMRLPMITIDLYIARILKYSPCSKECFITTLMYIDRLITQNDFIVNSYNIHRILITSILVSAKYLDDIFYNNHFYSQVGGVSVKEINEMEIQFLKLLSFDLSAQLDLYNQYCTYMEIYNKNIQTQLKTPQPIGLKLIIEKSELDKFKTIEKDLKNDKNTFNSNNTINSNNNSNIVNTSHSSQQPSTNNTSNTNNINNNLNNNQNPTKFLHQSSLSSFRNVCVA